MSERNEDAVTTVRSILDKCADLAENFRWTKVMPASDLVCFAFEWGELVRRGSDTL